MIVFLSNLLSLFATCRLPTCNSSVDPDNIKVTYKGAMTQVTATCNANHTTTWQSSPTLLEGSERVSVLNILLGG